MTGRTGDRSLSRIIIHEFTSWHEYLGGAYFFPLCNVNAVLGRISMDELTVLVDAPLDNDVCCIEYEEAALLRRHAGVRQLQRLTGIGKNIISNVSKNYISRQDNVLTPCPRKLQAELGWEPSLQFEEGIEKTVKWYLENEAWMDNITSGEYYEDMYKGKTV